MCFSLLAANSSTLNICQQNDSISDILVVTSNLSEIPSFCWQISDVPLFQNGGTPRKPPNLVVVFEIFTDFSMVFQIFAVI